MAKNYIEQFMEDNELTFNTYFKVDGSSANYRFDSDYRLWENRRVASQKPPT